MVAMLESKYYKYFKKCGKGVDFIASTPF